LVYGSRVGTSDRERIKLLDKRMLRVLAHPLRMQMLDLLQADGCATATGLGRRLGESSGTTSWHLRQLAEVGLVEEVTERGNKRERWWRSVHESVGVRSADFIDDPDLAGPLNVYNQTAVEQRYQAQVQFVSELPQWMDRWKGKARIRDGWLSLTPDEAAALSAEVGALVDRYRRPPRPNDDMVVYQWAAFPRRPHPQESDTPHSD
jgi:DNA-binding transcriptional ArsR family regulator